MFREHAEQFEHKGLLITIDYDTDPESPREWDNAGWMICWHRRYNLGDSHKGRTRGRVPETHDGTACESSSDFKEWWDEHGEGGVILPLYLYDHSGITMSTGPFSCPWDSGQVGYIYVTREKIREEWGAGKSKRVTAKSLALAEKCLKGEVETYDEYLTGQVFGYTISTLDPLDGDDDDRDLDDRDLSDHLASCWGFYGEKCCREEAIRVADYHAKAIADAAAMEANHFVL